MRHLLLALAFFFICLCGAEKCMHPPPSPNYNNELYSGRWYEVGKYQTFGGAIFQRGTVCTIATYAPYNLESGGGDIGEIKGLKLGADIFLRIYFRSKQNVCMFYTYTQMGKDCNGFFLPPWSKKYSIPKFGLAVHLQGGKKKTLQFSPTGCNCFLQTLLNQLSI